MKFVGNWVRIFGPATQKAIDEAKTIARKDAEKTLETLGALDYLDSVRVWVMEDPSDPLGYPMACWKVALPDDIYGADAKEE